jgi:hypothetical protein
VLDANGKNRSPSLLTCMYGIDLLIRRSEIDRYVRLEAFYLCRSPETQVCFMQYAICNRLTTQPAMSFSLAFAESSSDEMSRSEMSSRLRCSVSHHTPEIISDTCMRASICAFVCDAVCSAADARSIGGYTRQRDKDID